MMDTLIDLESDLSETHNTAQGTRNMAGKHGFAGVDARLTESNAKHGETQAILASLVAAARTLEWICGLALALCGMLVPVAAALVLRMVSSDPAPIELTVATALEE